MSESPRFDFFISRRGTDAAWAEWIAFVLEEAGYSTFLQDWDFLPGSVIPERMQHGAVQSDRTIAVVSPDYVASDYCNAEWLQRFFEDPTNQARKLIAVRVRPCDPPGFLGTVVRIDLDDRDEQSAREELLRRIDAAVEGKRLKPASPRQFPGVTTTADASSPVFPPAVARVWRVPHRRNRNFTGRKTQLDELARSLAAGTPAALTQAIHGLGGVGKSQLAIEYAYSHASRYAVIWWLDAETPTSLVQGLGDLGQRVLPPKEITGSVPQVAAATVRWLHDAADWLLIFDNVPEPSGIQAYLPGGQSGHVIITTRHPDWRSVAQPVRIPIWERPESVRYFEQRTNRHNPNAADELARDLGDLPLALSQAAGYVESHGISLAEYVLLFRTKRRELWQVEPAPDDYEKTVAITWEVALLRLSKSAVALLRLLSFFAPDGIPRAFFTEHIDELPQALKPAAANPIRFGELVRELRGHGLLEIADSVMAVHRLVQTVVRDGLSAMSRRAFVTAAVNILVKEANYQQDQPATWKTTARLVPHVELAVEAAAGASVSLEAAGLVLNECSLAIKQLGQYSEARKLLLRAIEIDERAYAPDHPTLATRYSNLALVERDLGNLAEARKLMERANRIRTLRLRPDHPLSKAAAAWLARNSDAGDERESSGRDDDEP